MAFEPVTRYADSAGGSIAYQVVGEGPLDLVVVPGWLSHVDLIWRDPDWERLIGGLASFSRVILYDPRGNGLSDPIDQPPTLELRADDLRAVLDAAGSERAALFGFSMGGPLSVMFAATHPERTSAIVLYGTYATGSTKPDGTAGRERYMQMVAKMRASIDHWGEGRTADWAAPSRCHSALYRRAVGAYERASMSPTTARLALEASLAECDVRSILGSIRVPTLVLHRRDEAIPVEYGRYLAEQIPGANLVELDGVDHLPFVGDIESIVGEVEEFLTGARHEPEADRVLATVLFTDIVDSTRRAAALGDHAWRDLLERHDELTRAEIARSRGREVKQIGDGFLATFDGPARALRCALSLREGVRELGIEIRAGVHTGECELRGQDVGGIAVHIGARISASAGPGEVLASSTVRDLVAGSGIAFEDRGVHALKGVPGEWRLFAPVGEDTRLQDLPTPPEPKSDPVFDRISRMPRLGRVIVRATRRR
jgi:pimeloyl-ACP methyl ester carboxylesterase/class 3 adenylate cyclase